jgi:hypothetical protein
MLTTSKIIGFGPECKVCGMITHHVRHCEGFIAEPGQGWHEHWYRCCNKECKVTMIPIPGTFHHPHRDVQVWTNKEIRKQVDGKIAWQKPSEDDFETTKTDQPTLPDPKMDQPGKSIQTNPYGTQLPRNAVVEHISETDDSIFLIIRISKPEVVQTIESEAGNRLPWSDQ